MTVVLNGGGGGSLDDSRNIRESKRGETDDNSRRKTRMERGIERERGMRPVL